jgi:hypothetical protein
MKALYLYPIAISKAQGVRLVRIIVTVEGG